MKLKRIMFAAAGGLMALGLTQAVLAQSTSTSVINATYNAVLTPSSATTTPGAQGAILGTLQINNTSGNSLGFATIPITFSPSNGGSFSNLSNCQLYNSSGQVIGSSVNTTGTSGSSVLTFTPTTAIGIASTTATNITVRCDISSSAPVGSTFPIMLLSAPTLTGSPVVIPPIVVSTTTPSLIVSVSPATSVTAGAQNTPIAFITLDARGSGTPIRIGSLPITTSFTGGLGAGNFTDCRVVNSNNTNVLLNSGSNVSGSLVNGSGSIMLDTPLVINPGTATTLIITCDVSPFTPTGTVLGVSVTPGTVPAVNTITGVTFTPVSSTLPTSGTSFVLGASTGTPGLPNTGMGGNAINFAVLASVLMGSAALMLARRKFI